jgi:hypothetical protein
MLSIAVGAALGSATRFLGDAGCLLYKQSNLTLKSVAADGGQRQSILDFRLEIGDWRLEIGDWRFEIGDLRFEILPNSSVAEPIGSASVLLRVF